MQATCNVNTEKTLHCNVLQSSNQQDVDHMQCKTADEVFDEIWATCYVLKTGKAWLSKVSVTLPFKRKTQVSLYKVWTKCNS